MIFDSQARDSRRRSDGVYPAQVVLIVSCAILSKRWSCVPTRLEIVISPPLASSEHCRCVLLASRPVSHFPGVPKDGSFTQVFLKPRTLRTLYGVPDWERGGWSKKGNNRQGVAAFDDFYLEVGGWAVALGARG